MDEVLKKRSAAKGWVTRTVNNLNDIIVNPLVSVSELTSCIEDFDSRLNSLDDIQAKVELQISADKLDADIDIAYNFRLEARSTRAKADAKLKELLITPGVDLNISGVDSFNSSCKVKLPKLELPKFDGKVTEWQSFWDQFVSHVDNSNMPIISKFSYLQSLLLGEAKQVIQGLAHSNVNYSIACDLLKERYGRPERIIFFHVQELLCSKVPVKSNTNNYISQLWSMRDDLLSNIRSLGALGISGEKCEVFLTPIILSRLPNDLRLEWAREGAGHEGDLDFLLKFLQKEIERIERSETFKDISNKSSNNWDASKDVQGGARPRGQPASAAALHTNYQNSLCNFCNKNHKSENCFAVLKLNGNERYEKIKSCGLCFTCLKKGHYSNDCSSKCTKCNGKHNIILCGVRLATPASDELVKVNTVGRPNVSDEQVTVGESAVGFHVAGDNFKFKGGNVIVLQTSMVKVLGNDGVFHEARILFDSGADRTYVSHGLVRKCKSEWVNSEFLAFSTFGSDHSSKVMKRNIYKLQLLDSQNNIIMLQATEIEKICQPLVRPSIPNSVLSKFSHLKLADNYSSSCSPMVIDILVGLDSYWNLVSSCDSFQSDGIVALKSSFGYILSGMNYSDDNCNNIVNSLQLHCISTVSDCDLKNFWNLESVGIGSKEISPDFDEKYTMEKFAQNCRFVQGRYEVGLPWKDGCRNSLVNNEIIALKRLNRLHLKFANDKNLLLYDYYKIFDEYLSLGIIEEVPSSEVSCDHPVYYLPHRPVIREGSVSTKIRPVFDASACCINGISLNDCLYTGPSLNPNLVEILIRFRKKPIALSSDITKAFLQIEVRAQDRDVHRFLLKTDSGYKHMRFRRVPFGNTASPFLLNATIKLHLSKYANSEVAQELSEDMYVDNWLTGADSTQEASDKFAEAVKILGEANMPLTKLVTNNMFIADKFGYDVGDSEVNSVLGLKWINSTDMFCFDGMDMDTNFVYSKRLVLSMLAKIFDPLGLICPFVMYGKILFQEIWRLGLDWDECLPNEMCLKFKSWIISSNALKSFYIERCYFVNIPWRNHVYIELHAFSDASEKGYGSCVYIRTLVDGSFYSKLVIARAKVAPIKTLTLPRLELMGAYLSAKLIVFTKSALHLDENVKIYCWTDSKITLSWIKSDPYKWKMFIKNRVVDIQSHTSPSCWRYCESKSNPADLISRGVLADKIISNDLWFHGPRFLSDNVKFVDIDTNVQEKSSITDNINFEFTSLLTIDSFESFIMILPIERWGTLSKAIRVTAWVLRFIKNCKSRTAKVLDCLSNDELNYAKSVLIGCVQKEIYSNEINCLVKGKCIPRNSKLLSLDPFLDEQGLLRIKGRLEYSELSYESKHPVIIPKCYLAKLLIQFQHLLLKHAGINTIVSTLRNHYWIICVRRLTKSVVKQCLKCQRHNSRPCSQPIAPLPSDRIKLAPVFSITGLDYAGPLYCADTHTKKFYLLLFTCAVVRGIHVELTDSLALPDCIIAFRKFVARRGLPSICYSDNAKTFVVTPKELQKYYGHLAPTWKFITPKAPWWGGWWERLIRSVKTTLRKSLGIEFIPKKELEVVIYEVEACINSRPLTYASEEPDVHNPLSPSHFIVGRNFGDSIPIVYGPINIKTRDLHDRIIVRNQILDKFWKLWSNDYIRNLPPAHKGFIANCNLEIGSLVLVRDDNIPRLRWPLGLVINVFHGKDGYIRSVNVKTSKGIISRPIQKLHHLEINDSNTSSNQIVKDINLDTHDSHLSDDDGENLCINTSSVQPSSDSFKRSRYGRILKPSLKS